MSDTWFEGIQPPLNTPFLVKYDDGKGAPIIRINPFQFMSTTISFHSIDVTNGLDINKRLKATHWRLLEQV